MSPVDLARWAITRNVTKEIEAEREAQDVRWGEQNHPDGTSETFTSRADEARATADLEANLGSLTWRHILEEEVAEAFAESDPAKLRAELVQVAAVATNWIEAIDRRADA